MKNLRIIILCTSLSFVSSFSFAGNEGGGGIGVKCGNATSILDLYEAENIHNRSVSRAYMSLEKNLREFGYDLANYESETGLESLDPDYVKDLLYETYEQKIINRFIDIPNGERLPFSGDATLPNLPTECEFVQIAYYNDLEGKVYRDLEYWEMLSVQDQAALIFHEGIFWSKRASGVYNSDTTRFIVGLLFSNSLPAPIWEPTRDKVQVICGRQHSNDKDGPTKLHFIAVEAQKNGIKGLMIYFSRVKDEYTMERRSGFVPNVDRNSIFYDQGKRRNITLFGEVFKQYTDLEWFSNYQGGYGVSIRLKSQAKHTWLPCYIRL